MLEDYLALLVGLLAILVITVAAVLAVDAWRH